MKVVLINTYEQQGGAAIACKRLMQALEKQGIETKLIVKEKTTNDSNVISINKSYIKRKVNYLRFIFERLIIFAALKFKRNNLFSVSIANTGTNISNSPIISESDIIHIHWINQGFLSLKDIEYLIKTNKPIVWTMHDMWSFTGICHHAGECDKYTTICNYCPLLEKKSKNDLSTKIFKKKIKLYLKHNIIFVGCSYWLKNCAITSKLITSSTNIFSIPNPINTQLYKPTINKNQTRTIFNLPLNKKILLFGSAKVTDEQKGAKYMIDACKILLEKYAQIKNDVAIVLFGKNSEMLKSFFTLPTYCLEYISNQDLMISLYNSSDIFVTSSLQENLPNTIMESMACGAPCVGFNIGGIPEMIDHKKNGYIANYKSSEDLADGIYWTLFESDYKELSIKARTKVCNTYSEEIVSNQYIKLYKSSLSSTK